MSLLYLYTKWQPLIILLIVLISLSLTNRNVLDITHRIWMKFTLVINFLISNSLLVVIYYGILFPIALISRLFKANVILDLKSKDQTMFNEVSKGFGKNDFVKPW